MKNELPLNKSEDLFPGFNINNTDKENLKILLDFPKQLIKYLRTEHERLQNEKALQEVSSLDKYKKFYKNSKTLIQRGEQASGSKLTKELVKKIRNDKPGRTYSSLANEYGVSTTQIFRIICREDWKHIK